MPTSSVEVVTVCAGTGAGPVLRLDQPLSFWGGTSLTGDIIDRHHPQHGGSVAGRVLVMRSGRGSSSSSSVLAEQVRAGTSPAAIVLAEPDAIVALGVLVAAELYGTTVPVVVLDAADFDTVPATGLVRVRATEGGATVEWDERS